MLKLFLLIMLSPIVLVSGYIFIIFVIFLFFSILIIAISIINILFKKTYNLFKK